MEFQLKVEKLMEEKMNGILNQLHDYKTVEELVKDELKIDNIYRLYEVKGLLIFLYETYLEETLLMYRVDKYGLEEIFDKMYSDSSYITYYNSYHGEWWLLLMNKLSVDFPISEVTELMNRTNAERENKGKDRVISYIA